MAPHETPRPNMNYVSQNQLSGSEATAMAIALPAPAALKTAMLNARDGLMIITYQLIIRVCFLARRWNY